MISHSTRRRRCAKNWCTRRERRVVRKFHQIFRVCPSVRPLLWRLSKMQSKLEVKDGDVNEGKEGEQEEEVILIFQAPSIISRRTGREVQVYGRNCITLQHRATRKFHTGDIFPFVPSPFLTRCVDCGGRGPSEARHWPVRRETRRDETYTVICTFAEPHTIFTGLGMAANYVRRASSAEIPYLPVRSSERCEAVHMTNWMASVLHAYPTTMN